MRTLAIAAILVIMMASLLYAGANENVKVTVHVLPHASRSCSKNFPTINGCEDIITSTDDVNVDFFPVFFDITTDGATTGWQGCEYGVMWEGTTCMFTSCSDFNIGDIVNPGDGISHAWTECHYSSVAIPGFGWVYSYDLICIVPHPEAGYVKIGDCEAVEDTLPPISRGCAGTNGNTGDDPCALSVKATTWGQIKSMFK